MDLRFGGFKLVWFLVILRVLGDIIADCEVVFLDEDLGFGSVERDHLVLAAVRAEPALRERVHNIYQSGYCYYCRDHGSVYKRLKELLACKEYNYRHNYFYYSDIDIAGQEAVLTFADEIAIGAEFLHQEIITQLGF